MALAHRAIRLWTKNEKASRLLRWQAVASQLREEMAVMKEAVIRMMLGRLGRVFVDWRDLAQQSRADKEQIQAVFARWERQDLTRAFNKLLSETRQSVLQATLSDQVLSFRL